MRPRDLHFTDREMETQRRSAACLKPQDKPSHRAGLQVRLCNAIAQMYTEHHPSEGRRAALGVWFSQSLLGYGGLLMGPLPTHPCPSWQPVWYLEHHGGQKYSMKPPALGYCLSAPTKMGTQPLGGCRGSVPCLKGSWDCCQSGLWNGGCSPT